MTDYAGQKRKKAPFKRFHNTRTRQEERGILCWRQISKLDPDSPVSEGHFIVTVFKKHREFLFRILILNTKT